MSASRRLKRHIAAAVADYASGAVPDEVGLTPHLRAALQADLAERRIREGLAELGGWVRTRIAEAYVEGRITRSERDALAASWGWMPPR